MHEVTANRFRPQTFEELVGQDFVAKTIRNSINNRKIPNAYLLSGPRGCGKTSIARIIAKALNCVNGPTATPCNKCVNCVSITNGSNTDVIEIDGASNTGINSVRTIQEEILYPPTSCNYKVYIIDEVHMLSTSAFNALLKTIEEPPERVIFIFATTEINKVPATIRSRCQQFNLRLIPVNLIYDSLEKVLNILNVKFEPTALRWVSNEGKGSMRDSYTLLDQVVSFCDGEITLKKIQEKLGIASDEKIFNLVAFIVKGDRAKLLASYFEILESGISPEQIITDLIKFFRNLLVKKLGISSNRFIDFNRELITDDFLSNFTFQDIENILELLFKTYDGIKYSSMTQLDIEICLFRLLKYRDIIHPKEILKEIDKLKYTLVTGKIDPVFKDDISRMDIENFSSNLNRENTIKNSAAPNQAEEQKKGEYEKESEQVDEAKKSIDNRAEKSAQNSKSGSLREMLNKIAAKFEKENFNLSNAIKKIVSYKKNSDNDITVFVNETFVKDTLNKNLDIFRRELIEILQRNINIAVEIIDKVDDSDFNANILKFKKIFNGQEL